MICNAHNCLVIQKCGIGRCYRGFESHYGPKVCQGFYLLRLATRQR